MSTPEEALVKLSVDGLKRAKGKAIIPVGPFLVKAQFKTLIPIGARYYVEGDPEEILKYVERPSQ